MSDKKCHSCGKTVSGLTDDVKYCPWCGTKYKEPPETITLHGYAAMLLSTCLNQDATINAVRFGRTYISFYCIMHCPKTENELPNTSLNISRWLLNETNSDPSSKYVNGELFIFTELDFYADESSITLTRYNYVNE